jgi:hypothetical protein
MGVNLVPDIMNSAVERLTFKLENTKNPTPGAIRNGSVEEDV